MRELTVFDHLSLDGYFVDANGSMSWAKGDQKDEEWNDFMAQNASGGGTLLFGRITYQMMASYWPTPLAKEQNPVVAERMTALPKVVFSRTLDEATWHNTRLIKSDLPGAVRRLKQEPGDPLVILGSGSIVAQLAREGLIDRYQIVVNPVVLGKGRTMFEGLPQMLRLRLTESRVFGNGNAFLCYEPAA